MRAGGRTLATVVVAIGLVTGVGPVSAGPPPEETYDTEHFSITWVTDPSHRDAPDLTDADSNGVPDAVEAMAAAFEAARAFELGELGYREPPGSERYPLYVAVGAGTGYTHELPGGSGRSRPSFIAIPPRFVELSATEDRMRAFAAHEYMHAIQIGYDAREDVWITEASSSWVEDRFVDEANPAHHLLEAFVPRPRLSLDTISGSHEYGAWLFLQFLTERFGGGSVVGSSIIRELWEEMAVPEAIPGAPDRSSLEAIEVVVARRGTPLERAWAEFLLWRRALGHFEEGAAYKAALKRSGWPALLASSSAGAETCRLTTDSSFGEGLSPLSGDYVKLEPGRKAPAQSTSRLTVEGPAGTAAFYTLKPHDGPLQEVLMTFGPDGVATADIAFGRTQARRVIVGLGNGSPTEEESHVAYSLLFPGRSRVDASPPAGLSSLLYGTGAFQSGNVTCGGRPAPFADVLITETEVVSGRTQTYETETDAFGRWRTIVSPDANAIFFATVADPLLSRVDSERSTVGVRLNITADLASSRVPEGSPITISGTVAPAHPAALVTVEFRRPEGEWRVGAEVVMDASGAYEASFTLPNSGVWEIRSSVLDTGDDDHLPGQTPGRIVFVEPAS